MALKCLRERARFLLLLRFDLLEERRKSLWIVAALIHVLNAQIIRFRLEATAELQHGGRQGKAGGFLRC